MTIEDYKDLRISRAALGRHLTDLIDSLLDKEVPGDVFADTIVAVYLHIMDADYRPSADSLSDCDPDIFEESSRIIARYAARSAAARESARRRKAGLPPLRRTKRAKKPRRHNMIDSSVEKRKDTAIVERHENIPGIMTFDNEQLLETNQNRMRCIGPVGIGPGDSRTIPGHIPKLC